MLFYIIYIVLFHKIIIPFGRGKTALIYILINLNKYAKVLIVFYSSSTALKYAVHGVFKLALLSQDLYAVYTDGK